MAAATGDSCYNALADALAFCRLEAERLVFACRSPMFGEAWGVAASVVGGLVGLAGRSRRGQAAALASVLKRETVDQVNGDVKHFAISNNIWLSLYALESLNETKFLAVAQCLKESEDKTSCELRPLASSAIELKDHLIEPFYSLNDLKADLYQLKTDSKEPLMQNQNHLALAAP
ncbi:hypothetical protein E2562_004638 [Oryza meyeriana var. granulata]|uniref:Uncharacterized protein n=1 Tax=Oryza meyeriana var. granulata TaxID=110450 RepID=A0A6G1DEL7_9ORYZ|nr:hypothetical protein E2562_004638 [Oryza meyeriana var. granulata]